MNRTLAVYMSLTQVMQAVIKDIKKNYFDLEVHFSLSKILGEL